MNRNRPNKVLLCFLLLLAMLCGCTQQTGEPDKLGSWGQINQGIERGNKWRQIVTDSPFILGGKRLEGSWGIEGDYYRVYYGTYPCIDGSTVAVPMAVEFARQHLNFTDEDANDFAAFSTTHIAYWNLIFQNGNKKGAMIRSGNMLFDENRPVDLVIATEPSNDELSMAEVNNVTLVIKPVCYDAFVFITHKDNPVDSLTIEQIRDIYSGKIANWKDVGGKNRPIAAYQREDGSGSQTAMINMVMKDIPMLPPETVNIVESMGRLVETVAEYRNNTISIGYTYKYYIDNLYKNDNIKILKIEGISADENNIRTNLYPLTNCYYGVIRGGDENSTGGLFLDWMLSTEGQQCIMQAGYIPYIDLSTE